MEKVKDAIGGAGSVATAPRPTPPAAPPTPIAWSSPSSAPALIAAPLASLPTVLDQLVAEIDHVEAALLASVDGFGIAHSSAMDDEAAHAAMLAAAVGLAHQLAGLGGGDTLRQMVVEHDAGLLVVWPVGSQRVLAVVAATVVDQRTLRRAVTARRTVLAGGTA